MLAAMKSFAVRAMGAIAVGMPAEPWSERTSWWMDIVKSLISSALGFLVAYLLLDQLQQRRDEKRGVCTAHVTRMHRAYDEFERTTQIYIRATAAVRTELYRWRDELPTEPITFWWGPAYGDYQAALRSLMRLFPGTPELSENLSKFDQARRESFGILDGLIDSKLDSIADYMRAFRGPFDARLSDPQYTEKLRPYSREILEDPMASVRFFELSMSAARAKVLALGDELLSMPATDLCKLKFSNERTAP